MVIARWARKYKSRRVAGGKLALGGLLGGSAQNAEDLFFAHDEEVFAIDLDLSAGVLAEQDAIAFLHVERTDFTFFADLAFSDGEDFAFLRLILGAIGDD